MEATSKRSSKWIGALLLICLILPFGIARAQNRNTAEIVGTVTDPDEAVAQRGCEDH